MVRKCPRDVPQRKANQGVDGGGAAAGGLLDAPEDELLLELEDASESFLAAAL